MLIYIATRINYSNYKMYSVAQASIIYVQP